MYDASSGITWFIQQFINIGTNLLRMLDNFVIYGNITMLDFLITIAIMGAFLGILVVAPQLNIAKRINNAQERKSNEK